MKSETPTLWRKSSHSAPNNGECVEIGNTLSAVRDSKNQTGPTLRVPLRLLLDTVKTGQYDR
ncbi:MAG: DUF397 domain-containing protein [Candidatus Dormibacteria bacterium]